MSVSDIVQTPIRFTISDSPSRIGGMQPPFTIINLETEPGATVWFAHNPGLMEGLSTPLFAGSTLTWNVPGDFWAKCDMGMQCDIMLVKDITDWTGSGVQSASAEEIADAIVASDLAQDIGQNTNLYLGLGTLLNFEQEIANKIRDTAEDAVELFNAPLNAANGRTTGQIDLAGYRAVYVRLNATVVANDTFFIVFTNTAQALFSIPMRFMSVGPAGQWDGELPIMGEFLSISCFAPTTMDCYISGSRREQERVQQAPVSVNDTVDTYWELQTPGPGAGLTTIVTLPVLLGQYQVTARASIPAVAVPAAGEPTIRFSRFNPPTGGFQPYHEIEGNTIGPASPAARFAQYGPTNVPSMGEPILVQFNNTYAAAVTNLAIRITPISGYLP